MSNVRRAALLDAAEAEFATAGFDGGSLRKIMRSARSDPGAVHYHFGNREALAAAVLQRILVPLNEHRLALLTRAVESADTSVAVLVEALVRPDIELANRLHLRSPGRAGLVGAIYIRPIDFVEATVAAHFAPVAVAFRPHLEAALPDLPFATIAWRVRWCVFGTVGALLSHPTAAFDRSVDEVVTELVTALCAAVAAPLRLS